MLTIPTLQLTTSYYYSLYRYVAVDEGLEKLDATSAPALLRYLDPTAKAAIKTNPLVFGGLGGLVLAAVLATQTGA